MSQTMNDKLEAYLKERPNKWLDGMELARVAGSYAWRSRCADLRKRGYTIENKQQRYKASDGTVKTLSLYRYVPSTLLEVL